MHWFSNNSLFSLAEKLEIIDFYGRHKAKGMGYGLTARHFAQKWGYQNGLNAAAVRWCWMKREKIMKQVAGSSQSELNIKRELDDVELDEEIWDGTPLRDESIKEEPVTSRLSEDTSSSSPEQTTTKKARKYSPEQKADFIRLYDSNRENMTMGQITKLFESRWSLSPIHRRVVSRWLSNRETILSNETLISEQQSSSTQHHHHHHISHHMNDELHLPHSQSSYGIGFVYDFETNEIMYL